MAQNQPPLFYATTLTGAQDETRFNPEVDAGCMDGLVTRPCYYQERVASPVTVEVPTATVARLSAYFHALGRLCVGNAAARFMSLQVFVSPF